MKLNDRQKDIYELIKQRQGIIRQKEICNLLHEKYPELNYSEGANFHDTRARSIITKDIRTINIMVDEVIISDGRGIYLGNKDNEIMLLKKRNEILRMLKRNQNARRKLADANQTKFEFNEECG